MRPWITNTQPEKDERISHSTPGVKAADGDLTSRCFLFAEMLPKQRARHLRSSSKDDESWSSPSSRECLAAVLASRARIKISTSILSSMAEDMEI